MRSLKVIGKALVDVYDNMFTLLLINVIWALLAVLPVSMILSALPLALESPEPDPTGMIVLYLLSVLLVLTTGPATYAMAVMLHMITEYQAITVREFLGAIRQNFRRGWLIGLVSISITFLLLINLAFYATIGGWAIALVPLFLMIILLWLTMQLLLYPIAVITEGGPLQVLRNTAIVLFRYPGMAMLVGIVALLVIALSSALVVPWLILTIVVLTALGTRAVRSAVRRDRGLPEEDPLDTSPLPPIGGEDAEGRPSIPHYGWRAHRQEAPDEESSPSSRPERGA